MHDTQRGSRASRIDAAVLALDEPRHQVTLRFEEGHDLRPDAHLRGGQGGAVFGRPVDPQQLRVLAADAEDERLAADVDAEVAVRDPTAEDLDARVGTRPDALDDLFDHARILSPAGSKSGSRATAPGTQSPKTSTSTSLPSTASPAGRYAYAIDFPTV